jgi:CelD/BcsL family acetyltransferase involved in cellulose biosynthesis
MRADGVLHWWFPVYDPAFGNLAPGWMLLRELIAAAPEMGITRIDLGRGDDEYKRRAKTGETMVAQGMVTRNRARLTLRRTRESLVSTIRSSAVGPALLRSVRRFRNR